MTQHVTTWTTLPGCLGQKLHIFAASLYYWSHPNLGFMIHFCKDIPKNDFHISIPNDFYLWPLAVVSFSVLELMMGTVCRYGIVEFNVPLDTL